MQKFWIFISVLIGAMLLLFFVFAALELPWLSEDSKFLVRQELWVAALLGCLLLVADVFAPVPSSMIMIANGLLFGWVAGAALSLIGGLGAALLGHWIGQKGTVKSERWVGRRALERAGHFFQRYGLLALIVSRPLPVLAETVSITAGLVGMPRKHLVGGTLLGLLPIAVLYGIAGEFAISIGNYLFLVIIGIAALTWCIGKWITPKPAIAPDFTQSDIH